MVDEMNIRLPIWNNRRISQVGCLILISIIVTCSVLAAEKSHGDEADEKILFLHLNADSTGITLLDHIVAEGYLKRSKLPTRSYGLVFQVMDRSGENQFAAIVENPLLKKYEYEDPDRPGELKMKLIYLDEAEFWIRIPLRENMERVEFGLEDNRLSPTLTRPDKRLTGSIDLTFLTEVKK